MQIELNLCLQVIKVGLLCLSHLILGPHLGTLKHRKHRYSVEHPTHSLCLLKIIKKSHFFKMRSMVWQAEFYNGLHDPQPPWGTCSAQSFGL